MPPKRARTRRPASVAGAPDPHAAVPALSAVAAEPPAPAVTLPYPIGVWRALCLALAFFQPWTGFLLGMLYWQGPDGRARRFSRWCLLLALAGWFLSSMTGAFWTGLENSERTIQPW